MCAPCLHAARLLFADSALKPAERFIVPQSAGVPTIGYAYPSFREAMDASVPGARASSEAPADLLLTSSLDGLLTRLTWLVDNFSHWERARAYSRAVGEAHSMRAVTAAYERARRSAMQYKAPGETCLKMARGTSSTSTSGRGVVASSTA